MPSHTQSNTARLGGITTLPASSSAQQQQNTTSTANTANTGSSNCHPPQQHQQQLQQPQPPQPQPKPRSRYQFIKEGWGSRQNFQYSHGLRMDPDGIEEGNAILDAMEQAEELDRIAKAAGK